MSHAFFPFVLMRRDPAGRTPFATLSDGIHLALVSVTCDGDSKVLFREDFQERGLDPVRAYLDSRERLSRLVDARLVRMRAVLGPARVRCLAFEHSFLAASCAVLPDLFQLAHAQLKSDTMILAIPRRDLLVVAPNLGAEFRTELHRLLGVDDRTFSLEPSGPTWMSEGRVQIGPANLSNDGLRPYRQVDLRKRCA